MCTRTTWIKTAKLQQMQELFKAHDLRFLDNPFVVGDQSMVKISSDHLPPGAENAFWEDWYRMIPVFPRQSGRHD